jgi:GTP-binding protein
VLLHLIELAPDPDREPEKDHDVINRELARYDEELARRPQVVALSKMDVTETREAYPGLKARFAARGITLHAVSAVTGEGVPELLEILWKLVRPR